MFGMSAQDVYIDSLLPRATRPSLKRMEVPITARGFDTLSFAEEVDLNEVLKSARDATGVSTLRMIPIAHEILDIDAMVEQGIARSNEIKANETEARRWLNANKSVIFTTNAQHEKHRECSVILTDNRTRHPPCIIDSRRDMKKHAALVGEKEMKRILAKSRKVGWGTAILQPHSRRRANAVVTTTVYFDFETSPFGVHKDYCASTKAQDGDSATFKGDLSAVMLLEWTLEQSDNAMRSEQFADGGAPTVRMCHVCALNLSYDLSFLWPYLSSMKDVIEIGGKTISMTALYVSPLTSKVVKITFYDSYRLIPEALTKFPKMFGLGDKQKEVMPHKLMTPERVAAGGWVTLGELQKAVNASDYSKIVANANDWGCTCGDRIILIDCSAVYCAGDVEILHDGMTAFRNGVLEKFDMDCFQYPTIASMAYAHFVDEGCYVDVHEVRGVIRDFCKKGTVGGKVMVSPSPPSNTAKRLKGIGM
jgi:hypothetical protein